MTRLHMIGNAHIDPVWLWQWPEGLQEVLATFRSALDRMNEFDDFIFTASSAAFYEWVEQTDPAMFAEIQRRVAEGRWAIVGGWWIEPDCNVPCGESLARQALYGQRYFREKFGRIATTGYAIDSFGHHGMLPQILKQSGLDSYVFMRPGPHEQDLPGHVFWWEAGDGSRVLAFRILHRYLSRDDTLLQHIGQHAEALVPPYADLMCFYGVGNHGGGPTQRTLAAIRQLQAEQHSLELILGSPDRFFAELRQQARDWPVVRGELQHHASGCYAAHSGIKRWNRQAENRLLAAEKFSAVAARVTGQPYPDLAPAWKGVLFNQFHDILAGTCIESAYDDARHLHGKAMADADRALYRAIQSLAWNIRIESEPESKPIVVFNPNTWASKLPVELEFGNLNATDRLLDDEGRHAPLQRVQSEATANGRTRLCFVADLPALGYRTYRLVSSASSIPDQSEAGATFEPGAADLSMENDHVRVEFDSRTGCIKSLFDKRVQVQVFSAPAACPVVLDDGSDTWSHGVFKFDRVIGAFTATRVERVALGPVKSVIRVTSEHGRSKLIQEFALYHDLDWIEVGVTVDWREAQKMLKLRFPLNLKAATVTHEIPYGHLERPANGEEEPMQSWVDVSGTSRDAETAYGLSLLNDGKYSVDVNGCDMGLTVLRSPAYAHHVPATLEPDGMYSFTDQGIQRFRYVLLPHAGDWKTADTVKRAAELNQPPLVLPGSYRPHGTLPPRDAFVTAEPGSILVSVLKQSEDNGDLIVRAYETHNAPAQAVIRLPHWNRIVEAQFGPCEIKTFRVPREAAQPVVETNLLEW